MVLDQALEASRLVLEGDLAHEQIDLSGAGGRTAFDGGSEETREPNTTPGSSTEFGVPAGGGSTR